MYISCRSYLIDSLCLTTILWYHLEPWKLYGTGRVLKQRNCSWVSICIQCRKHTSQKENSPTSMHTHLLVEIYLKCSSFSLSWMTCIVLCTCIYALWVYWSCIYMYMYGKTCISKKKKKELRNLTPTNHMRHTAYNTQYLWVWISPEPALKWLPLVHVYYKYIHFTM